MPSVRAKPLRSSSDADRVLLEARKHFFAHGFRGVTLDDLAAELRMSKKTLYTHFPGKAALVAAILADKLKRVETDLRALREQPHPEFSEHLKSLLTCLRTHMEEIRPPF